MKNLLKQTLLFAFFVLAMTSCVLHPKAPDGLFRYNSPYFRFRIDYSPELCSISNDVNDSVSRVTIEDKNGSYWIDVIALKIRNEESVFKLEYYNGLDTLCFPNLGTPTSVHRDFFTDRITRLYTINDSTTIQTTCAYGWQCVYLICSKYTSNSKSEVERITDTFKTSACVGPLNFMKRKMLILLGDSRFTYGLNYFIFTVLLTFVFWGGAYAVIKDNENVYGFLALLLFLVFFGYFSLSDYFMGYIYGHNTLLELICRYLMMFFDTDM
jgi:hypothetical protein